MSKWIPSIIGAIGAAFSVFVPEIQSLLAAHPAVSGAIMFIYSIFAHILPSPLAPPVEK